MQQEGGLKLAEYIEREAARKMLEDWADGYSYIEIWTPSAFKRLEAIPAADVVPVVRHGRWEKKKDAINWSCSLCGNEPFHCHLEHMNFCPNCGAKMYAKENETRLRKNYIDVGSCRGWIVEGGLDKDGDGE